MKILDKYNSLALLCSIILAPQLLGMENRVNIIINNGMNTAAIEIRYNEVDRGHEGIVYECSPIKGSPRERSRQAYRNSGILKGISFEHDAELEKIFPDSSEFFLMPAVRKILAPEARGDLKKQSETQQMIRQLLREKFNDKRYRHIPKIEESKIEGIKMEYADGKKLTKILEDFSVENFLEFMKIVIDFVASIHNVGYGHADLSPDNIIVEGTNLENFKIIDFELSGKLGIDKLKSRGEGKYSAPEAKANHVIQKEADIYSLGKILELFFQRYYANDESYDLINNMTKESPGERISLASASIEIEKLLNNSDFEYELIYTSEKVEKTIKGYDNCLEIETM